MFTRCLGRRHSNALMVKVLCVQRTPRDESGRKEDSLSKESGGTGTECCSAPEAGLVCPPRRHLPDRSGPGTCNHLKANRHLPERAREGRGWDVTLHGQHISGSEHLLGMSRGSPQSGDQTHLLA